MNGEVKTWPFVEVTASTSSQTLIGERLPRNKHGNSCTIMLTEFFSHFPQAYAAKSYDVIYTLASTLFKHLC